MRQRIHHAPTTVFTLLLLSAALSGCHSPRSIVGDAPWREDARLLSDTRRDATPRAQVFICYDRVMSSHVALRLTGPMGDGRSTLLWDPAGFYGSDDPAVRRQRDVLTQGTPTLAQWMDYRVAGCGEVAVLMFEYDLTPDQLDRLSRPLLEGAMHRGAFTAKENRRVLFNPSTGGGFCCVRLSRYLETHGQPGWRITGGQLMPHDFGARLWRGGFNRAVWFAPGRSPRVYERQGVANDLARGVVDEAAKGEGDAAP